MAKIGITETVLRDAHQSLIATRMRTDEFEGILEKMDKIGYHSLECWGGATFDACLRFLDEDPWDRLRLIRKKCPNTKLQMLFRGQNMLGYRHYSDELVDYFVKKSIDNGIDILRMCFVSHQSTDSGIDNAVYGCRDTKKDCTDAVDNSIDCQRYLSHAEIFVFLGKEHTDDIHAATGAAGS